MVALKIFVCTTCNHVKSGVAAVSFHCIFNHFAVYIMGHITVLSPLNRIEKPVTKGENKIIL